MARWEPDARERLERAAWELFAQQGFAATTVPEITARAGLTTRTFFRYFADKREVIFAGDEGFPARMRQVVLDAPAGAGPGAVIAHGLDAVVALFADDLEGVRRRRAVVADDDGLRERELHKFTAVEDAIADGFRARGVDAPTAVLSARLAVVVVRTAIDRWVAGDGPLADLAVETLAALGHVTAEADTG